MFNLSKQVFLVFIFFVFISCSQDPLKGISENMRKGIYNTGPHNQNVFKDNFLSSNSVGVTFKNKVDLTLPFREGETSGHVIKIKPLYKDFPFDIDVKFSERTVKLYKDFKWVYYKDRRELVITWKPDRFFVGYQETRKIKIPFFIELRDLSNLKKPAFVISKKLFLEVEKVYEIPEIVKYTYNTLDYEKMEDGNFYEIPKDGKINLKLNREIYDYFSDAEDGVYKFGPPIKNIDEFKKKFVYDSKLIYKQKSDFKPIERSIYLRLQKPIYEKKEEKDCPSNSFIETENGKTICYVELEGMGDKDISIDTDIYETYYEFPDELIYKHATGDMQKIIFDRKTTSIYKNIGFNGREGRCWDGDFSRNKFDEGDNCYVQVLYGDVFIREKEYDLYYAPNGDDTVLYPIENSQLKKKFRLMPKYLKSLVSGVSPQSLDTGIHLIFFSSDLISSDTFEIHVRDVNQTRKGSSLLSSQRGDVFPPISLDLVSRTYDNDFIWNFKYEVKNEKFLGVKNNETYLRKGITDGIFNNFYSLLVSFEPTILEGRIQNGREIPFVLHAFPRIQSFFKNQSKKDSKDMEITQEIEVIELASATPQEVEPASATPQGVEPASADTTQEVGLFWHLVGLIPQGVEPAPATPQGVEPAPATPQGVEPASATPQGVEPAPATPQGVEPAPATPQGVEPASADTTQEVGNQSLKKVNKTLFNLSHNVKIKYVFPTNAFRLFSMLPLERDLTHITEKTEITQFKDIIDIELEPYSITRSNGFNCIKTNISNEEVYGDIFESISCPCEPVHELETKSVIEKVVLEKECTFNVKMGFNSETSKPVYVFYKYGFDKNRVHVRNDLFRKTSAFSMVDYLIFKDKKTQEIQYKEMESKYDISLGGRHFFLNLTPSMNCLNSASSEVKICTVFYNYENPPEEIEDLNQKNSFIIDLTCTDSNGVKRPCDCEEKINFTQLDGENGTISKKCEFKKEEHGVIVSTLRTNREDVFFIHTTDEMDVSDIDSFRKTRPGAILH